MIIQTSAIVLHTIAYSDTSIIAKLFTREKGLISVIVKGAKGGKKNKKGALFQALNILSIQFNLRENKDLHYLNEMSVLYPYSGIPFSTTKTAQALFIAEVLRKAIREEEQNHTIFDFILDSLQFLDEIPEEVPSFHLKFLLELTRHLGFYPENNYSTEKPYFQFTDGSFHHSSGDTCLDANTSSDLNELLQVKFAGLVDFKIKRERRKALMNQLLIYYQWHLPSFQGLQTPEVLEAVFG